MILIGVNDGHGLDSPGKRTPDGYKENEFNHWTKIYLIEELKRCGFGIVDCSPTRQNNSLQDRANRANKGKVNAYISIHYNAMGSTWNPNGGKGLETYHHQDGVEGGKLARLVHKYLIQGTPMVNRGVKTANFQEFRQIYAPTILVECGFMDYHVEAELMKSRQYRIECAIEICKGVCEYFGKPYIPEIKHMESTRDRIKIAIRNVSPWYEIYLREFDKLQKNDVNVYGLIEKLLKG